MDGSFKFLIFLVEVVLRNSRQISISTQKARDKLKERSLNLLHGVSRDVITTRIKTKGTGKRGHIVADILLPTQMFPRLPARATFVSDTNFVSGDTKNVSDFVQ